MTTHRILSCDACNPDGVRTPEQRRNTRRDSGYGRRAGDGCRWFEGAPDDAVRAGWVTTEYGHHVCPECVARGLHERLMDAGPED